VAHRRRVIPGAWHDNGYDSYEYRGDLPRTAGYQSTAILGPTAGVLPKTVGGSDSTYYCDYFYTSIPPSGISLKMPLIGGRTAFGTQNGLICSSSFTDANVPSSLIGFRLRYEEEPLT